MTSNSGWNDRTFRAFYDKLFGPNHRNAPSERFFVTRHCLDWPLLELPDNQREGPHLNLPKPSYIGKPFRMAGARMRFFYRGDRLAIQCLADTYKSPLAGLNNEGVGLEMVMVPEIKDHYPGSQNDLPSADFNRINDEQAVRFRLAPRRRGWITELGKMLNNEEYDSEHKDLVISVWLVGIFKMVDYTIPPAFCAPGDAVITFRFPNFGQNGECDSYVSRQLLISQSPVLADFFRNNPKATVIHFKDEEDEYASHHVIGLFVDENEPIAADAVPAVSHICEQLAFTNGLRACGRIRKRADHVVARADKLDKPVLYPLDGPDFTQWTMDHCNEGSFVQQLSSASSVEEVAAINDYWEDVGWSDHMLAMFCDKSLEIMTAGREEKERNL